jgi:hypothetical protein
MARKHHISPAQTVLWTHHELTSAWAPSGILHPTRQSTTSKKPGRAATSWRRSSSREHART